MVSASMPLCVHAIDVAPDHNCSTVRLHQTKLDRHGHLPYREALGHALDFPAGGNFSGASVILVFLASCR
jgi:hypothetical protein